MKRAGQVSSAPAGPDHNHCPGRQQVVTRASLPILPFPASIDRRDFGHYLCGLTDGEAYFRLCIQAGKNPFPVASFSIHLRADDVEVLRLVHSYLNCGDLYYIVRREKNPFPNARDTYRFVVSRPCDLAAVVVPHFDAFPLRAKKARDFAIWREAVLLLHEVNLSPTTPTGRVGGGTKWTQERLTRFDAIRLREQRRFIAPEIPPSTDEPTLFD